MSRPLKTIFISELILVFAMAVGFVPQEFSYLILILLLVSFVKMIMLDALKLFLLSIPFFVALPANTLSDSMSIWRVLILILFLKVVWEKYGNCHSGKCIFCHSRGGGNPGFSSAKKLFGYNLHCFLKSSSLKFWNCGGIIKTILIRQLADQNDKIVHSNRINKLFLYTILFFAIAMISLVSAENVGIGVKKILFLGNIILLFPIVRFSLEKEEDFIQILQYTFYTSCVVILVGYFQFISTFFVPLYTFWQFWTDNIIKSLYGQNLSNLLSVSNTWFSYYESLPPTLRMFSVMPDSHSFAMFVVISTPALLSLHLFYKNKKRNLFAIALIIFLMAISFSGSRGSWVSSAFALVASVLLLSPHRFSHNYFCKIKRTFNRKPDSKIIIGSVLFFLFLMPVSFFVLKKNQQVQLYRSGQGTIIEKSDIFERAKSIANFSEISNKGRFQIWSETLVSVREHPFLGVGFGNFPYIIGENMASVKRGSSAHNIYLDILSETGIFGLMIFLLILFEILRKSYFLYFQINEKYLKIFAGSFFVYFTWIFSYGLFDVVLFNDKVLIFAVIMMGLLYSIGNFEKSKY